MPLIRRLVSTGPSPRIWEADVQGATLRIATGTAKRKGSPKETSFPTSYSAHSELRKLQRKKLRDGYILEAPEGPLAALLGIPIGSYSWIIDVTPDGQHLWCAAHDESGRAHLRVIAIATGRVVAERDVASVERPLIGIVARSPTRAWVLGHGTLLIDVDLEGDIETLREVTMGSPRALLGRGDHLLLVGDGALLVNAGDGSDAAPAIADVTVAASAPDGCSFALSAPAWNHVRVVDFEGKELARVPLATGGGVRALAIDGEHVAVAGTGRRSQETLVWSLTRGARVSAESFADGNEHDHQALAFGANGKLLVASRGHGGIEAYALDGGALKLRSLELGESRGLSIRVSPDGRWLAGANGWGNAGLWDLDAVLAGPPSDDFALIDPDPPKTYEDVAAPRMAAETITLPLGKYPFYLASFGACVIYNSFVDGTSTLVDLSVYPPTCSIRAQIVSSAARHTDGGWLLRDREGLWETDHYAEQGRPIEAPASGGVGLLDDVAVVFDDKPASSPLLRHSGGWRPITGQPSRSESDHVGCIRSSDGASYLTWAGVAYRVTADGAAERAFALHAGYLGHALALSNGIFAFTAVSKLWSVAPGRSTSEVGKLKQTVDHVLAGPTPASMLVTFGGNGGNRTLVAGAVVEADGTSKPIEKAAFGLDKKEIVSELVFACDRILARVTSTSTFGVISASSLR